MAFNGEKFVESLRAELEESRRGLKYANWVEGVARGATTKEELVGWARQHYWGVTYHTRRFLSVWLGRVPYEMTDDLIANVSEEVLGTQSGSGKSHLHWLFHFTRALGAPDTVITQATPNTEAILSESYLFNMAHQRPWHEMLFGAILGIENQIPEAYTRVVRGFEQHYKGLLKPDDYRFHTIHITVDEEHGGHVSELAELYLDTEEKRRSARAAYFAGAEACRRCWDGNEGARW